MGVPREPQELTTWQEIADYFGVTVRTAQLWRQRRGLPVRKIGGRVSASTDELDLWRAMPPEARAAFAEPLPPLAPRRMSGSHRALIACLIALTVTSIAGGVWLVAVKDTGQLVRIEASGKTLTAFDEHDHKSWSYEFGNVIDETPAQDESQARSLFADIDGDGNLELLFLPWEGGVTRALYVFRRDGDLLWKAVIGHAVVDGDGNAIAPRFAAVKVALLDKPRPDGGRIVVLAKHLDSWPSVLAVLTRTGSRVAEFWHTGPLLHFSSGDLDSDGIEEIVLGGVNRNLTSRGSGAELLVLDSRFSSSQGPLIGANPLQLSGIPAATPKAILVFPEVPGLPAEGAALARVQGVSFIGDHLDIMVRWQQFQAHYQLDRQLAPVSVTTNSVLDDFMRRTGRSRDRAETAQLLMSQVSVVRNCLDEKSRGERTCAFP